MQRVFLSPPNWLGFEQADFVFLLIAAAVLLLPIRLAVPEWYRTFARRRWTVAALLFVAPICLRLALLAQHPEPVPSGADDFGYLLLADTLRHGRFANPAHAWPQFFEQIFILQRPTYSSMFNLGQGFVLTLGWAGVLLCAGALSALTYWMLLGWLEAEWAFAGGALAAMLFGPLCYWTNCYWGGGLAACAGCLVFGALPRLQRDGRARWAWLLGIGLAVHLLTRPFESIFLVAAILLFCRARVLISAMVPAVAALGLIALQNAQVTGSWHTLPYQLYRYDYGIPATFTFQNNAVPHVVLNMEQERDYRVESAAHGYAPESPGRYATRLLSRVRFLRFFLFAPLYIGLIAGVWKAKRAAIAIGLFALGSNFYPFFYPHYVAALASVFLLVSMVGLRAIRRGGLVALVCAVQFVWSYFVFASGIAHGPTWNFLNGPDPQGRATIAAELARMPGKQLVFVHYSPEHSSGEWVHNAADIDGSRTIWVHDIGPLENKELASHYRDRSLWMLKPDFEPPVLEPYRIEQGPFADVP